MNEERNESVITATGIYSWWLATQIFCIGGDRKMFEVMISAQLPGTLRKNSPFRI